MDLPIPFDMTEEELEEDLNLQKMIGILIINIIDYDNIRWMKRKEIINLYNDYYGK